MFLFLNKFIKYRQCCLIISYKLLYFSVMYFLLYHSLVWWRPDGVGIYGAYIGKWNTDLWRLQIWKKKYLIEECYKICFSFMCSTIYFTFTEGDVQQLGLFSETYKRHDSYSQKIQHTHIQYLCLHTLPFKSVGSVNSVMFMKKYFAHQGCKNTVNTVIFWNTIILQITVFCLNVF